MDGPEPVISTHGNVPDDAGDYAKKKIAGLYRGAPRPVIHASCHLTMNANPAVERPAEAEATLDMSGHLVRGHVSAETVTEAIDFLDDRLRRQLKRLQEINITKGRRPKVREEGEWRHGDEPALRPRFRGLAVEDRRIERRKTFAVAEMTPDEAVFELEQLDHDFYLFVNIDTHEDNVVQRLDDATYLLAELRTHDPDLDGCVAPIKAAETKPAELTVEDAQALLDVEQVNFVFFLNTETDRGNVLYRRFDGHYGHIVPSV